MHEGVRITIPVSYELWRRLRDLVETERKSGRASLSRVIVRILEREVNQQRIEGAQGA
jgi:hypothetical protein